MQQKNYPKAIEYYQSALQADALSPLVAADLRRELAEVYLLNNDPKQALVAITPLGAVSTLQDETLVLTHARIQYELGDYVKTADALEQVIQLSSDVDEDLYQQVVALSYGIQGFELCGQALKALIEQNNANATYWSQMVSVLLKQRATEQALYYLILARQQGLLRDESNTLLLSSLYVSQGNPYAGAELLQQELATGVVAENGEHYKRLFEYWWQAREEHKALGALAQAATRTGEEPLYLFWAQTLMKQARWQQMNQVILQLCQKPISPASLGHANLLLGISRYELDKPESAYEAFASATLTGGVNAQAGNWLSKLEAEGVTGVMPTRPRGPCQPKE